MRMSKAFLALLLILSTVTPTAHAIDVPASFSFQGSGYGHGVGLSQMGARSMALAGQMLSRSSSISIKMLR
jgi:SpoIID/LytB domain protein